MTDLTTQQPNALQAVLADPERLKDFPIETLERLFDLHKVQQSTEARIAFNTAFNAVQAQMHPVMKKATNKHTQSTYARAEDVMRMLDPIIIEHGFSRSLSTEESPIQDHMRFVLILRHKAGHEERHTLDAPLDNTGIKGNPTKTKLHGMASSFTYCERHLLCKVFGVQISNDDDGNAATIDTGEKITSTQQNFLRDMLEASGADIDKFFNFFSVKSLADLPANRFNQAKTMLTKRMEGKE